MLHKQYYTTNNILALIRNKRINSRLLYVVFLLVMKFRMGSKQLWIKKKNLAKCQKTY